MKTFRFGRIPVDYAKLEKKWKKLDAKHAEHYQAMKDACDSLGGYAETIDKTFAIIDLDKYEVRKIKR